MKRNTSKKLSLKKKGKKIDLYAKIDWEKAIKLFQETQPISNQNRVFPSVKQVLHFVAAAGSIGLIFAFPGAAPVIGSLIMGEEKYKPWQINKTLNQLAKQKFVEIKQTQDGKTTVKVTRNGIVRALSYKLDDMRIKKPKKWDGKWRVVIFDIPEKYRKLRNIYRQRLVQMELHQLQESVYVSPYPCFNEVEFLRELYGVAFRVRYLLVDKIEDDGELRDHFSLNS